MSGSRTGADQRAQLSGENSRCRLHRRTGFPPVSDLDGQNALAGDAARGGRDEGRRDRAKVVTLGRGDLDLTGSVRRGCDVVIVAREGSKPSKHVGCKPVTRDRSQLVAARITDPDRERAGVQERRDAAQRVLQLCFFRDASELGTHSRELGELGDGGRRHGRGRLGPAFFGSQERGRRVVTRIERLDVELQRVRLGHHGDIGSRVELVVGSVRRGHSQRVLRTGARDDRYEQQDNGDRDSRRN